MRGSDVYLGQLWRRQDWRREDVPAGMEEGGHKVVSSQLRGE